MLLFNRLLLLIRRKKTAASLLVIMGLITSPFPTKSRKGRAHQDRTVLTYVHAYFTK
jgi:hypothetical protein